MEGLRREKIGNICNIVRNKRKAWRKVVMARRSSARGAGGLGWVNMHLSVGILLSAECS